MNPTESHHPLPTLLFHPSSYVTPTRKGPSPSRPPFPTTPARRILPWKRTCPGRPECSNASPTNPSPTTCTTVHPRSHRPRWPPSLSFLLPPRHGSPYVVPVNPVCVYWSPHMRPWPSPDRSPRLRP
ncbi:hypothetical protein HMI54_015161 [Coelomomyces lativittatus]|nr:hypothetical protein HMI54_015161 [Coelomomyces lativittatus]